MLNRILKFACTSALLMNLVGCGEPLPEGLPTLYPAKVKVIQAGSPLTEASVTCIPEDSKLSRWPVGGVTDASGVVELSTFGKYPGAPEGKFKVVVSKSVSEGTPIPQHPGSSATAEQMKEYDRAMKSGNFQVFDVVDSKFRSPKTSTLEIEITSNSAQEFSLDVGKAVKEKNARASSAGSRSTDVP